MENENKTWLSKNHPFIALILQNKLCFPFREKIRHPLRVQFFDEAGVDMGGPRRELLRIISEHVRQEVSSTLQNSEVAADSNSCERFFKYGLLCGKQTILL